MPALRPQARFLLRGSAGLFAMLALWWFVLRSPMLEMLDWSESFTLRLLSDSSRTPLEAAPSGDWNFRVPVQGTGQKIGAIEFTIPRADLVLFTFSVPVFWAIVLAAPIGRSSFEALFWGTALVSLVEVLSLLALVEITAYTIAAQWNPAPGEFTAWLRQTGNNLIVGVIPFAAPVVAAVALHRDLRAQIFHQPTA